MRGIARVIRIGYFCSYVPAELLGEEGIEMVEVTEEQLSEIPDNHKMINTLCTLALKSEALVEKFSLDAFIFTNCCNSMQRAYDFLRHEGKKVYMLDIERSNDPLDEEFYEHSIRKLIEQIKLDFGIKIELGQCSKKTEFGIPTLTTTGKKEKILVVANIIPSHIEELLRSVMDSYDCIIKSCNRMIGQEQGKGNREPCVHSNKFYDWLIEMVRVNRESISGIIFLTSSYCDASLYLYPTIREKINEYNIPIICLETSFSHSGLGQLSTRIEAFIEGIQNRNMYHETPIEKMKFSINEENSFLRRMSYVNSIVGNMEYDCLKILVSYQIKLITEKLVNESEKIVWTNMVMPVELFYSMGLIPVQIEMISGWLASLGLSKQYIMIAESAGVSTAVCAYDKAILGLFLSDELLYPKTMVFSSVICDGAIALGDLCSKHFQSNVYEIDVPYYKNKDSVQYVKTQYQGMMEWIQEKTGVSYSEEEFRKAMKRSDKTRKIWIEDNIMRKDTPEFQGRLALRNMFGTTFLFGSETGLQVVEAYKRDLQRLQGMEHASTGKKNILWAHFSPLYRNELMEYMEDELGLKIVTDIVSYIYWDEYELNDLALDAANRLLSHIYDGDVKRREKVFEDMIEKFKIDGIIHYMHRGCRTIIGSAWLVRDIAKKHKIPYMELYGDCIDPRGGASQQDYTRLEAFKESLEGE